MTVKGRLEFGFHVAATPLCILHKANARTEAPIFRNPLPYNFLEPYTSDTRVPATTRIRTAAMFVHSGR
jgi:hypothetical protein